MLDESHSLEILKEITKVATSALDLDNILNKIITVIKNKMHIDACGIYLLDEEKNHLHLKASNGLPFDKASDISLEMGKGVTGWVAQNKVTLALSEALQDPRFVYFPEIEEEKYKSMLSVPILSEDRCIGVINVHTHMQRTFSEMEIALLETIAHQVSGCILNAIVFTKGQMHLKELSILYDIGLAVQSASKLEDRLWIILSGVTRGDAGGFNRAILLLLNEKTRVFQGIMGMGPSPEDVQRIWADLSRQQETPHKWLVTENEIDQYNKSTFNNYSKTLRFAFQPGENIFSEAAIQGKTLHILDAHNHPLVPKDFLYTYGCNSFAIAPLVSRNDVLGLFLADNRYNFKPISEATLRLLTRFAVNAGWVIDNSRLFAKLLDTNRELLSIKEQLIESEKLSALGELSAEVAHEIKNPLVSIGGFARRLNNKISSLQADLGYKREDLESIANYSNIIVNEVERLENMLKNILIFSKGGNLQLQECDLRDLLNDVTTLFQTGLFNKSIVIKNNFDNNIEPAFIDYPKMKQVLINLFYNALESMSDGGELSVNLYVENDQTLAISIKDTGCGIPEEIFAHIFNPFFTTKGSGTGLGLAICRKIVESHGGRIHVENNPGKGVTVYIHLPLQKVCDYTSVQ